MRAFNARKTCKEHYLFKNKFKKLSLTNKDGGIGVFRVRKLEDTNYKIFGDVFAMRYCFQQINKILINAKYGLSIGQFIRIVEKANKLQIKDIGLTREAFYKYDFKKIADALNKYKSLKIKED